MNGLQNHLVGYNENMLDFSSFAQYVEYYRKKKGLNYSLLAEKLGCSLTFASGLEQKGKQLSDEKIELFAKAFDLSEIEFVELLLQRTYDQYEKNRGKKALRWLKRALPVFDNIINGKGPTVTDIPPDPLEEIRKNIAKISDLELKNFLENTIDFAIKHYLKEGK
ncbi:MAG: hypothetical protein DKM50_07780 [Candidatus Margulisiibacteriota bacterium]|nr:MAG: hypothetical protein A2X43_05230 [Candidatus Margulisbacteria bacterium GWD2_39_127]OGI11413.1 MAG: hypothetical protein A2X41_10400 [Candidatus Margulisbacteria bacterium GWE2_39_32]PZM79726.1 MAG: hypothetical protein DKM50_07780 [Candidatus Margulisiibacteriota bacterium]HAR63590.1 hypothetical protein [Candidatus Margulisiibacteriota bacterium]HCT86249.1 hypothetical protein [Candidatus Margulisiibacteriota bacterium]